MNIRDVVAVHGGIDRWRSIEEVCLRISVGGVAFTSKGKGRAIRAMNVSVCPKKQRPRFFDYPARDRRGTFERGPVRIESAGGQVLAARSDSRTRFRGSRRAFWWDDRNPSNVGPNR